MRIRVLTREIMYLFLNKDFDVVFFKIILILDIYFDLLPMIIFLLEVYNEFIVTFDEYFDTISIIQIFFEN
jgi:hypothetical protein